MDLREKVAKELVIFMPAKGYGDALVEARKVAAEILAIPEIAEALDNKCVAAGCGLVAELCEDCARDRFGG